MASKKKLQEKESNGGKYINPYTDFRFKKLFGTEANKDVLQHFLQSLLQLDGKLTLLKYLNNAQLGRLKHERGAVFDIYCETDNGEKFIVEMQKCEQKFFKDRSLFYATFPIQEQAKRGPTWNFELKAIYTVAILDFVFDDDIDEPEKYYYHIQLSDTDTHEIFYDKLTFVYLEMPKFRKNEDELETFFDKWLYVIKNLSRLQTRPQALQERIFQRLFHIAEIENLTLKERRIYDDSLKNYWDMQNVIDTAVEKAVKNMQNEIDFAVEKAVKNKQNEIDTAVGEAVKNKQNEIDTAVGEAVKNKQNEIDTAVGEAVKIKEDELAEKDIALAEKDQALAEKDIALAEKEKKIKELLRQLQH
jgi:predicted transposase/invertase (TIGR01784 family)